MSEFKVLLVDDEQAFLSTFLKRLKKRNINVEAVTSGEEALEYVENNSPDVIILDVKMPVMGGKHAASEIRSIEEKQGREPAVLLGLTAYAEKELVDELMQHGMNGVIHKPITEGALIRKINSMLESRDPE